MTTNGMPPPDGADKSLGDIVAEVSEKASQLVREEIELAKAEVTDKVSKLTRGAGVAAAAGVFLVFGVTMFFHGMAWFLDDVFNWEDNVWAGFAVVTARSSSRDPGGAARVPAVPEGVAAHAGHGDRGGEAHPRRARGPEDRARPGAEDAPAGQGGEVVVARERSPEMIRAEIEETRRELAFSVNDLRSKVTELTNWRGQLSATARRP